MRWAWLPIPAFAAALAVLWLLNLSVVAEPPYLLPALNFTFTTAIGVFVAVLAAMSFLRQPSPGVLLIGTGTLIFALVSLTAGIAIHLGQINTGITVYNTGACLAGLCHLVASLAIITGRKALLRRAVLWPAVGYVSAVMATTAVTLLAWENLLPTYFVQGEGATQIRQVVLAGAIASFGLSAILLTLRSPWHRGRFIGWYSMGLALIATGLLGVMPIHRAGTPLGWVARSAQYLGGIYLLIAVLTAARHSGHWDTALQTALRQSRDRFRALVAASAQMVWTTDPQGRLVEDSPSWRAYTGQSYAQAQGWGWSDAIDPDHREQAIETWRRSVETLEPFETEYLTHHHSGQWRWTEARAVPLLEPDGEVSGWVVMNVDIHERKKAEQALRESEDRFRAMADGVAQIIWMMDAEGNQTFVNQPYLEFFGLNRTQAQSSKWRELIHPEDAEAYLEAWREAFADRKEFRAECRTLRADGQWRWVASIARPRFDEQGRFIGYVGTGPDITDRKHSEQALLRARDELEQRVRNRTAQLHDRAEQLAQLTSELTLAEQRERRRLAKILHDHLQQLLVGAKFGLDVLHRKVPEKGREGVERVADLIDEALNASRSLTVEISPPILHEAGLAAGLEWLGRWMTQKHGLAVKCRIDPNAGTPREDVRVLLFESTRELLFNVVKHAGVTRAEVQLSKTDDEMLQVTVTDTGKGFDPEGLSEGRQPEGGFGLFSIRERLALLGGRMDIRSHPGDGASFTLTAPARASEQADQGEPAQAKPGPSQTPKAGEEPAAPAEAIRLLLVDDHEVMRQGLAMMLSEQDDLHVVGEASTGVEAIRQARELEPDMVLMDFSMPEMDGVEATEKLSREMPTITIIGLSMYEQSDRSEAMISAGASAYLSKSGPPAELLKTIHRLHAEAGGNGES